MRHGIITLISAVALTGAAGCGSDNGAGGEQAATATTPRSGQETTTDERTHTTTDAGARGGRLSPEGRAVLAAAQDLAADVSATAEDLARGRIERDEARVRLELASERADDLRRRAQQLPATERTRARLTALTAEISRTATAVSKQVSSGRAASRDEIEQRIAEGG
jgi:hypothetical protein